MNALERTRLEKAGADCGFDLTPQPNGDGLDLRSAQFPEVLTVWHRQNESFSIEASNSILLPGTALGQTHSAHGWQALYSALETASSIARTLTDRVAQQFAKATANMPTSTEVERLVVQRVGHSCSGMPCLLFGRAAAALPAWQGPPFWNFETGPRNSQARWSNQARGAVWMGDRQLWQQWGQRWGQNRQPGGRKTKGLANTYRLTLDISGVKPL